MGFLILGLAGLCSIVSIVCWIIVLIKIFGESVGKGILGLICALYAFIWGWQNKDQVGGNVMMAWTAAFIIGIILNVLARSMTS